MKTSTMVKLILGYVVITLIVVGGAGCADEEGAAKVLKQAGYTNVETTGYTFFGCGEHDFYRTTFKAVGPTGIEVEGVVCSGFFKGNTIRLD